MVIALLKKEAATVYPNVKEFLELLRENGVQTALATSTTQKTALEFGKEIMRYFDVTVFAEDVTNGKPESEIFLTAATRLGLPASACAVFENATEGVKAAKASGLLCIARENHLGQNLTGADLTVTDYDPQKLLEYIRTH